MNLLLKQGFYNSIILYAGIALGFFNSIILFNLALTTEEIGFYGLLIAVSGLYGQIASLGSGNIVLRYFPFYKTEDKKHGGFVTFILLQTFGSFVLFTALFILLKGSVLSVYQSKAGASLLIRYYHYIIPVAFFTLLYALLESFARAIFKNVLSAFLKEVLLRLFTSISAVLIFYKIADYTDFVAIFLAGNFIICLILWISLVKSSQFKIASITAKIRNGSNEMVSYGVFAVLSGSSFNLIQNLDVLMLSGMTEESLSFVGIYTIFFAIATVISLPARALSRTSYQIVSNAWKENDLEKIGRIYNKTSVVQSLVGCILLVGLIINKHNLIFLLHKPEYDTYFSVFIVVGIGFLVDITGGLNSHIINSSKYYKIVTVSLVSAVGLCGVLNLVLIPVSGLMGAALSYTLTMFFLNFFYWFFIKIKFQLQPFTLAHIKILVIGTISLGLGLLIPKFSSFLFDVAVRSSVIGLVYLVLAYFLNISEDINSFIGKIFKLRKE